MRISVIGAGRVAHHLAQVLSQHHEIVQVFSRDPAKTNLLAAILRADSCHEYEKLDPNIDIALIVVSDRAIEEVVNAVKDYLPDVLIAHTSGSTHISKITDHHSRAGVFYPLQTFSFESQIDWINTPLFIEATQADDLENLTLIAKQLSQKVYQYDSSQRLSLHLAAVFACNFSNYCYDVAKQLVDQQEVDFNLLHPLILETAKKATTNDPRTVQTGPAVREDFNILNMHEQMLIDLERDNLKQIYTLMTKGIQESK
jgi:predicted short-subunit dehydrogenase-like oxidoreductase (DUF2520 family)